MSYITIPRLVFSGNFQADVSTVNNDVRHYDNATFEARFQQPQNQQAMNGWYNPDGTGNFRLFSLQVRQALSECGADPSQDPATGLFVNAQSERSSCKIVDLDPQMQAVSMLFGLRLVLTDGTHDFLSGDFAPSAFRDLLNGRTGTSSAVYTSVLSNLEWSDRATASPTLAALKTAADTNGGRLSINMTPYNYGAHQQGQIIGSIGAYAEGDPMTFVSGRRLTSNGAKATIGDMMADVAGTVLSFDFSNSIGLKSDLSVNDIGEIHGAILRKTDTVTGLGTDSASITVGTANGDVISGDDIKLLDRIDYQAAGFLDVRAGLADCALDEVCTTIGCVGQCALDDEAEALVRDHPVAVVSKADDGRYRVVIRESNGGIYARADNFVLRMDPPTSGTATESVRFRIMQWGKPLGGVALVTAPIAATDKSPYWGAGPDGPNAPKATYPTINTPPGIASVSTGITSGPNGWADCPVAVGNPRNPRGYVDGQIYTFSYHVAVGNASPQAQLDLIVIHAREGHDFPDPPSWDDIAPFMQQYDNLYPIMSRHLFSLADPEVFRRHATLLTLAFSRPMDDPNHMPATRDLSASKRQAVLNWLAQHTGHPAPLVAAAPAAPEAKVVTADTSGLPAPLATPARGLEAMLADFDANDTHGKNAVIRGYLSAEIARLKQEG